MPAGKPNLKQRPEKAGDEPLLFELYVSARKEELDAVHWPTPEMRAAFLKMQFQAQRRGYAGMFPQADFLILEINGKAVGRVVIDRDAQRIQLVDIVLLPERRNAGIGATLIKKLQDEAATNGKPLRLYVVQGSRAARLYERLGFHKTGLNGVHIEMEWRAAN